MAFIHEDDALPEPGLVPRPTAPGRRINASPFPPVLTGSPPKKVGMDSLELKRLLAQLPNGPVFDSQMRPITSIMYVGGMLVLGVEKVPTPSGEVAP